MCTVCVLCVYCVCWGLCPAGVPGGTIIVTCSRTGTDWPATGSFVITDRYLSPNCSTTSRADRTFTTSTRVEVLRTELNFTSTPGVSVSVCPGTPSATWNYTYTASAAGPVSVDAVSTVDGGVNCTTSTANLGENDLPRCINVSLHCCEGGSSEEGWGVGGGGCKRNVWCR